MISQACSERNTSSIFVTEANWCDLLPLGEGQVFSLQQGPKRVFDICEGCSFSKIKWAMAFKICGGLFFANSTAPLLGQFMMLSANRKHPTVIPHASPMPTSMAPCSNRIPSATLPLPTPSSPRYRMRRKLTHGVRCSMS